MKFEEIVGRQADDPAVHACLAGLGFTGALDIPPDDTDVYVNLEAQGISFLFEDARHVGQKHNIELTSSAPVLTAVFLYAEGVEDFSAYSGDMPSGLEFSDSQQQARAKLGQAVKFNEARRLEIWQLQNKVRLFVIYDAALNSVLRVNSAFCFPDRRSACGGLVEQLKSPGPEMFHRGESDSEQRCFREEDPLHLTFFNQHARIRRIARASSPQRATFEMNR